MRCLFLAFVLLWPAGAVADFDAGYRAYERGDHAAAMREWLPLAEQGDASAQYNLGLMYDFGRGVPEDDGEAVKWYRKAADQGYADAQYNLGDMYYDGEGVPEDHVHAYAWFNLAAAQGHANAAKAKGIVETRMTPSQIAQAQSLSTAPAQRIGGGGGAGN